MGTAREGRSRKAAIGPLVAAGIAVAGATGGGIAGGVDAATSPSPSGIGNLVPAWIAVSPAYARDGLVAVVAGKGGGCSSNCGELWLSRDRGDSWTRVDQGGFTGSHLVIGVDGTGREILYATTSSGLVRSADLGATWSQVGATGLGAVSPNFTHDATVAVAAKSDYVLRGVTSQPVSGSNGTMTDATWAIAPGFPSTGARAPVLLGGVSGSIPTVDRCTASFSCSQPTALPAPDSLAGPPNLFTSSTYVQDGTVFAQTADGVYKSTDGGATFAPLALPTNGATHVGVAMLALSPAYSEAGADRHVYVAALLIYGAGKSMTQAGAIYASSDGGATWGNLAGSSVLEHGAISVAVAPDGRVFAGYFGPYGAGLLCNPDGTTWRAFCAPARPAGSTSGAAGSHGTASASCAAAACASPVAAATGGIPDTGAQQPNQQTQVGARHPSATSAESGGGGLRIAAMIAGALIAIGAGMIAVVRRRRASSLSGS